MLNPKKTRKKKRSPKLADIREGTKNGARQLLAKLAGSDSGNASLLNTPVGELSASQLADALANAQQAIDNSKTMLPEDAGLLMRFLQALKTALLLAAGLDIKTELANKQGVIELIESKLNEGSDINKDVEIKLNDALSGLKALAQ